MASSRTQPRSASRAPAIAALRADAKRGAAHARLIVNGRRLRDAVAEHRRNPTQKTREALSALLLEREQLAAERDAPIRAAKAEAAAAGDREGVLVAIQALSELAEEASGK